MQSVINSEAQTHHEEQSWKDTGLVGNSGDPLLETKLQFKTFVLHFKITRPPRLSSVQWGVIVIMILKLLNLFSGCNRDYTNQH